MSFDYNKWESEFRSKVEEHEFAFDKQAWEEMDKLLSQGGGTIAPNGNIPPASAGRFTSWIISGMIVTAIGLFSWWMLNPNDAYLPTLSSFSVTVTPEEEPPANSFNNSIAPNYNTSTNQVSFKNAPTIAEAGNTSSPKDKQVFPADSPITIDESATEQNKSIKNKSLGESTSEIEPLADRSAAYLTPMLRNATVISLLPTALDEPVSETLLVKLRRKRNRKTLYPDIIESY